MEDHFGDMDFKVAGTHDGITAVQLDIKLDGVPLEVLAQGVYRARNARTKILDTMNQCRGWRDGSQSAQCCFLV